MAIAARWGRALLDMIFRSFAGFQTTENTALNPGMTKIKEKIRTTDNTSLLVIIFITALFFYLFTLLTVNSSQASSKNKITSQKKSQEQNEAALLRKPRTIYVDSQTGYTVYPEEIEIRDITTRQILYQKTYTKDEAIILFKDGTISASFLSSLPVPADSYECTIKSTNYKPYVTPCRVGDKTHKKSSPASSRDTVVNIDPIEGPSEAKSEYLMSLKREDAAIFTGFIADDDRGLPLAGVHISSKSSNVSTTSDDRGYFILAIPVPSSIEETGPIPDDIIFEKDEYQKEVRRYVVIWKSEVSLTKVRLMIGKGENIVDTRKHRKHFQFPDR